MMDLEQIDVQQSMLANYRRRLDYQLNQLVLLGTAAPFHLVEEVRTARVEIERIKIYLRSQDIEVDDLPNDVAPPESVRPAESGPISGKVALPTALSVPSVWLQISDANGTIVQTLELTAGPAIIGRSVEAKVLLEHERVSRQHARLDWNGEQVTITDLGSTNGSLLDNARLNPQIAYRWNWGVPLRVGVFVLRVEPPGREKNSGIFSTGISALADLVRVPEFRQVVAAYEADFATARQQIDLLGHYKRLHDGFQQLENRHELVTRATRILTTDLRAWDDLERDEPELQAAIAMLLSEASDGPASAEQGGWTQKISRASQELRTALDTNDSAMLKAANSRLRDVIGRELSRSNTRLISTANALRLSDLLLAMQTVRSRMADQRLTGEVTKRLAEFDQGVVALSELCRRLIDLVSLHKSFQDVDDELRRIEAVIDDDISELLYAWPDLLQLVQYLHNRPQSDWANKMAQLGEDLALAIDQKDPLRIRRTFRRYRSHVNYSFNQVDVGLLRLCSELQEAAEPLARVLRMIA